MIEFQKTIAYFLRLGKSISYTKIFLYSLIVIFIYELIAFVVRKIRHEKFIFAKKSFLYRLNLYLFIIYSNFVLRLTYFGREWGSRPHDTKRMIISLSEIFSKHGILNGILFIPFGFLLYGLFVKYENKYKLILTVLLSMAFTMVIEIMQFVTETGRFELNDLICNSLGGVIGALIAWGFYCWINYKKNAEEW